jgi:hypothetical protein
VILNPSPPTGVEDLTNPLEISQPHGDVNVGVRPGDAELDEAEQLDDGD